MSTSTPDYSALMRYWRKQIGKNYRHGDGGGIAARLVVHGFIRSVPDVISMVMTMKMMIVATLLMMPAMAMLALAMILRPRPLGPLEELSAGPRSARGWACRHYEVAACDRGHWGLR